MNKLRNKKKKGFTLIELVIVLAVLAIIALIAIPNFNKVRTDSQVKADQRTCEVIEKVTLMAIADLDMVVGADATIKVTAPAAAGSNASVTVSAGTITWKADPVANAGKTNYEAALKEISAPQVKGAKNYEVEIDADTETVTVKTINS